MKYLYILTSDETDSYLEQTLLSMISLKSQMPDAFVSLLIDNITETNIKGNRKNIFNFVDELKTVNIDSSFDKKSRSRWLKTSMRKYITNDFLYIDGDTIIVEDLSDLNTIDIYLGAVLDEHNLLSNLVIDNPNYLKSMQKLDRKLDFVSTINSATYFNGGLLLCKDNKIVHNFFNEWHRLWLYCFSQGIVTDQQSLNQTNYMLSNIISELEGKWNCQILAPGGVNYLHNAKIIHYFTSLPFEQNPYILVKKSIIEEIKKTGNANEKIIKLLLNPKSIFDSNSRLRVADKFTKSITYSITKKLFNSKFGAFIESILVFVYKYIFTPIRKLLS